MEMRSEVDEPEFTAGDLYYFVTYPDVGMMYPLIESYVFLGKNFSEDDKVDTWYFQSASDYALHGSAISGIERPVFCANRNELVEFQTQAALMQALKEASEKRASRRDQSGSPIELDEGGVPRPVTIEGK